MKVADYISNFLSAQGVACVFEVVGGMITHLIDSMYRRNEIRIISMHHEQAAAFAADAIGRLTGVPGVAMATSGPGATNLLTGIGSCYFDSSPAVFITGQVNRREQKGDRLIRQLGFQETDIVSVAAPITKAAWRVNSVEDVPSLLEKAFSVAAEGRPGPVLLDIAMDVQRAEISTGDPSRMPRLPAGTVERNVVDVLLAELRAARRPLVLVGGGVRAAGGIELFRRFSQLIKVPVVNSLLAVDVLPHDDRLRVGMIGTYGNRWANLAVGRSDVLLVLGSRLDIRQTGSDTESFKHGRTIYHIDCEAGEINNRVKDCRAIVTNLRAFFEVAIQAATDQPFCERSEWLQEIDDLAGRWPDTEELRDVVGINPNEFMHQLARACGPAAAYVVDVGQHQMWAAQSIEVRQHQKFLTSGGMGAMGFALPASIGAAFALERRPIAVIAGDGGFQLNIQELQTVVRNGLPIKVVVINNRCHGMVRQFQESYFDGRYQSTYWGYSAPDFARVARAYGIPSCTADEPSHVESALQELWRDPEAPFLLQVMIDTRANAYPKVAFGRPITEMEPLAVPVDIEST